MHGDASVSELSQFALDAHESPWDHRLVFEPKVEQVAHQEQFLAVGFDAVEKPQQLQLPLVAVLKRGDA